MSFKQLSIRLPLALTVVFSLVSTAFAGQELTARQWLDKMSRSHKEGSFQGVLNYQRGDESRSMKIMHGVIDGQEYERLIDLEGKRFEIIKHGHDLSCVHVGESQLRLDEHAAPAHFSSQPRLSLNNDIEKCYQLSLEKGHRVADRAAIRVVFKPRDEFRYQRIMLLDEQTGLLLQSQIVSQNNKVLEQFKYLDVNFGAVPDEQLKLDLAAHDDLKLVKHPGHDQAKKAPTQFNWQAGWLPEGFVKTTAQLPMRKSDNNLSVQMYSDGLSSFTIFIDSNTEKLTGTGRMKKGATAVVARSVSHPDVVVTVAGEIPLRAADKIAQSVTF